MIKLIRRWWKYSVAKLTGTFNEKADPKVQLEQAIIEAQDQHGKLKEQAANVIANQKQTEIRLNRTMEDYEKVSANARQAVKMADDAQKSGDQAKFTQYTTTAESFANRMIALEHEVENLKALHLNSSQAAEQAKNAVSQNSSALQKKLTEKRELLSQIDQSKMQEQLNSAMESLNDQVGKDVPSFEEIRNKVESRYAKAKGTSELNESSVEGRMREVEQASINMEAQTRLEEIRSQLGLGEQKAETATEATEPAEASEPTAGGEL